MEVFEANHLISLKSFTITNGSRIDISGEKRGNKFIVTTSSGTAEAPLTIFPSDPWMVKNRGKGVSVAIETGEILPTQITGGESASISVQNVPIIARHFVARGEGQQYDVWLNNSDVPVMFQSIEDGTPIDFILTSSLADAEHVSAHLVPTVALISDSDKILPGNL